MGISRHEDMTLERQLMIRKQMTTLRIYDCSS